MSSERSHDRYLSKIDDLHSYVEERMAEVGDDACSTCADKANALLRYLQENLPKTFGHLSPLVGGYVIIPGSGGSEGMEEILADVTQMRRLLVEEGSDELEQVDGEFPRADALREHMGRFDVSCPLTRFRSPCHLEESERRAILPQDGRRSAFLMFDFAHSQWEVDTVSDGVLGPLDIRAIRADGEAGLGKKFCKICRCTLAADFGIAFLSPLNPNVLVEIGYCLGRNRQVVYVVKQEDLGTDAIPFDLSDEMLVPYDGPEALKDRLTQELRSAADSLGQGRHDFCLPVPCGFAGMRLTDWEALEDGEWRETHTSAAPDALSLHQCNARPNACARLRSRFRLPVNPWFGFHILHHAAPPGQSEPMYIEIGFCGRYVLRVPHGGSEGPAILEKHTDGNCSVLCRGTPVFRSAAAGYVVQVDANSRRITAFVGGLPAPLESVRMTPEPCPDAPLEISSNGGAYVLTRLVKEQPEDKGA